VSQSNQVQLQGILTGGPAAPSFYSGTLMELLPVSFCDCYTGLESGVLSNLLSGGGSPPPFVLSFGTITKARVIAFRLLAGLTVTVTLTTALGPATFNVSDQFLLRVRNPGDEVTAISINTNSQTVDLAYLIAGDVS
jgi:hypothetical protein